MKDIAREKKTVIWIVEDHEDCRRAVARVINRTGNLSCDHAFTTCEDALAALAREPAPDVMLLDVGLPQMNGIQGIREINSRVPSIAIIMLTVYDDHEKIFEAISAGASGYLLKTADAQAIINAIREVQTGGAPMNPRVARMVLEMLTRFGPPSKRDYGLSPRESEVLELMSQGLIKKEIADRLGLSYHTVDNHLRNIYSKLHVNTRSQAVAKALGRP